MPTPAVLSPGLFLIKSFMELLSVPLEISITSSNMRRYPCFSRTSPSSGPAVKKDNLRATAPRKCYGLYCTCSLFSGHLATRRIFQYSPLPHISITLYCHLSETPTLCNFSTLCIFSTPRRLFTSRKMFPPCNVHSLQNVHSAQNVHPRNFTTPWNIWTSRNISTVGNISTPLSSPPSLKATGSLRHPALQCLLLELNVGNSRDSRGMIRRIIADNIFCPSPRGRISRLYFRNFPCLAPFFAIFVPP